MIWKIEKRIANKMNTWLEFDSYFSLFLLMAYLSLCSYEFAETVLLFVKYIIKALTCITHKLKTQLFEVEPEVP